MARLYNFSVVQFQAHPLRNEHLNLAIVVFLSGGLDVRPAKRLDKLKAISGALDVERVRQALYGLATLDLVSEAGQPYSAEARLKRLAEMSAFRLSPLGRFLAPNAEYYEANIQDLLATLVEPEPAAVHAPTKRSTGLLRAIKTALRTERVLARNGEGLDAHRVVPNHQIAEGLRADLLLKNGSMHIIETVDASADESSLARAVSSVAVSALVFEQARMVFGSQSTKSKLVYTASTLLERAIIPSLLTAEHQGAELINWQSADDRRSLIVNLSRLATPLDGKRKAKALAVDASVQPKLKLH